jgi:LPS export ABC transporter protein LptC
MGWRVVGAIGAITIVTIAFGWQAPLIQPVPLSAQRLPRVAAAEEVSPSFVNIQGTRLVGADAAGRPQWELQAASLQMDQSRSTIALTSVTAWLYRAGDRYLQLRAPQAVYASGARIVDLSGGVSGSAPDGRTFTADRVRWTGAELVASGRIMLTQRGLTVRAERMSIDAGLDKATFEGHVAITFPSP